MNCEAKGELEGELAIRRGTLQSWKCPLTIWNFFFFGGHFVLLYVELFNTNQVICLDMQDQTTSALLSPPELSSRRNW